MTLRWLNMQDFVPVIQLHDQHRDGVLRSWRTRFAALAAQLATYVADPDHFSDVPGLPGPPALAAVFRWQGDSRGRPDVFQPWMSCWSGQWVDGRPPYPTQYHIWDNTEPCRGQLVQPVTQSRAAHVSASNYAFMLRQTPPRVDTAINVFSDRWGITGWVSKRQGDARRPTPPPTELPHVGYSLDARTLVWITHEYPTAGFRPNGEETSFWMFVERVGSRGQYSIRGRQFQIVSGDAQVPVTDRRSSGHTMNRPVQTRSVIQVRDGGALGQASYQPFTLQHYANPADLRRAYPTAPPGMPEPTAIGARTPVAAGRSG